MADFAGAQVCTDIGPNLGHFGGCLGARLDFANTLGTTVRLGGYMDLDFGSVFATIRLETRLNDWLSLEAVGYMAEADDQADRLYTARDIDQLSIGLIWNF